METIREDRTEKSSKRKADTVSRLGRFVNDVYMHKRIHSSLGYLLPAE